MTIGKILTFNAVHLSDETLEILNNEAVLKEAGARSDRNFIFLHVHMFGHPNTSNLNYLIDIDRFALMNEGFNQSNLPEDLRRLLRKAWVEGCDTLRINDNAPVCMDLPRYNCN